MKNKIKTIATIAMALSASAPVQVEANVNIPQENTRSIANKQEGVLKLKEERGQGISIKDDTGGLGFDFPRMFLNPSPIFDPKRPHPIQSYRSQQRAAKKRKHK